jgi:hypothetical protein
MCRDLASSAQRSSLRESTVSSKSPLQVEDLDHLEKLRVGLRRAHEVAVGHRLSLEKPPIACEHDPVPRNGWEKLAFRRSSGRKSFSSSENRSTTSPICWSLIPSIYSILFESKLRRKRKENEWHRSSKACSPPW